MGEPETSLDGRRIVVHVCGGIAAVKVPQLITALLGRGAVVRVAMTPAAGAFVSALSLRALSGHPVATGPVGAEGEGAGPAAENGMAHLELSGWADCHLVVPATASTMARLASGLADDVVSSTLLATTAPILLAPAMETNMWLNPATTANRATLANRGFGFVGPVAGRLASGGSGEGRMAEPAQIVEAAAELLTTSGAMAGMEVLVTSGGTREPIDPVRYLANRSSGRMGNALAAEALRRGARVHLVSAAAGPAPAGIRLERVETAEQMLQASLAVLPRVALVLMAAAVADYRVAAPAASKLHRSQAPSPELRLVATVDVLSELLARRPHGCRVVGFAAETEAVRERGLAKLRAKGCDMLVANPVSGEHSAMGGSHAEAFVLLADGRSFELPWSPKERIAAQILDLAQLLLVDSQGTAGRE